MIVPRGPVNYYHSGSLGPEETRGQPVEDRHVLIAGEPGRLQSGRHGNGMRTTTVPRLGRGGGGGVALVSHTK